MFIFFKQQDSMDCGPTCLRMVAKFYGRNYSPQTLREKTQIGKDGVSLLGIAEAAELIGFRTQSYKLTFQSLVKQVRLPAILHWDQTHFVVLYKVKKNKYFIADPGKGLIKYNIPDFRSHWISDNEDGQSQGVALLLEPSPGLYSRNSIDEDSKTDGLQFKNIFRYARPYRKLFAQLFAGLIVGSMLQVFLPFLTQSIVDTGVNTANIHFVYIVLLAQLALFAGRTVIEFIRGWILLHISTRINISILTDFLIKLMKLPLAFFDSRQTGDILQRMSDHKRIESFLTGSSLIVLFSLTNLIIFSAVLAIFNIWIFGVFAFSSLIYAAWVVLFLRKRRALDYRRFEVASRQQSLTIQLINGMQEIKLNGAEQPMRWNWERLQASLFGLSMMGLSINQWQQAGAFIINEGKNICITFLSAKAVIDGEMTLGAMLAVQYIIGQLNSPIEQVIGFVQSWQNAKISMDRLNEIHEMDDEEPVNAHFRKELPTSFTRQIVGGKASEANETISAIDELGMFISQGNKIMNSQSVSDKVVSLRNLYFSYPGAGNQAVLKGINLEIPKGKITAIVGNSGSGKTTLLKLLLKFYDPHSGEIRIGNTHLSSISHRVWRSHCGVVMQESFIFSDTIARNIAVGQDNIDMRRLEIAATISNLREFVESLPLGYNTKIGAEGVGISMGQRQRILIARTVYRDPDFIFFDEATNSLDANNESIIIKNLELFFKGRTVVVVAHRLSTVKHADQIIVLKGGKIVEQGTHQELSILKGEYFQLVKNQLELV